MAELQPLESAEVLLPTKTKSLVTEEEEWLEDVCGFRALLCITFVAEDMFGLKDEHDSKGRVTVLPG